MRRPGFARLLGRFFGAFALAAALWGAVAVALEPHDSEIIQHATSRYGARGGQLVQRWLETLQQDESLTESQKLQRVNTFWDRNVRGVENPELWHKQDYWATPIQTLGLAAGDCKAYVIGKYVSLRKLGVPTEKLRFVYVKALVDGQVEAHMVLAYYSTPTAIPLVLDNLMTEIMPANERTDLTPVLSFGTEGIYVNGKRAAPVDRIGHWRDLLQRMQGEGVTLDTLGPGTPGQGSKTDSNQ